MDANKARLRTTLESKPFPAIIHMLDFGAVLTLRVLTSEPRNTRKYRTEGVIQGLQGYMATGDENTSRREGRNGRITRCPSLLCNLVLPI